MRTKKAQRNTQKINFNQPQNGAVERLTRGESLEHVMVQTVRYSGPIPPAQELANYETVVQGAAERIIRMAEINQSHQHSIELAALHAQRREVRRGQVFGLIIATLTLGCCILALYLNHPNVALVIGGTTVVSLVYAFLRSKDDKSAKK